jgi:hypothetical protein
MRPVKKPSPKKIAAKKTERAKKLKKISLLNAAVIGAGTPTMGGLEHS